MIPSQLHKQQFVLCQGKRPIEKEWQKKGHTIQSKELQKHIYEGGNYGVLCGVNKLIVVDFDDQHTQEKVLPVLPDTFTVKSGGKGLIHAYYYTDNPETLRYDNEQGERVIDIQGPRTQVIGPNSIHPDTRILYKVECDSPVMMISMRELKQILEKQGLRPPRKQHAPPSRTCQGSPYPILQIAEHYGVQIYPNGTAKCPFHDDKNPSLSFTPVHKGLFYCFGCDAKGDAISFIQFKEGVEYIEAKRRAREITGVETPGQRLARIALQNKGEE